MYINLLFIMILFICLPHIRTCLTVFFSSFFHFVFEKLNSKCVQQILFGFCQCLTSILCFLIVFSHMPSICHSSVNTAHDCSSTKGHGIGTQNYIQAIDAIVVHIVNLHFHEGDLVVNLVVYFPLLIDANLSLT